MFSVADVPPDDHEYVYDPAPPLGVAVALPVFVQPVCDTDVVAVSAVGSVICSV